MTVAVIGHGKSPVGKRWGLRIDLCDTVIRLWDCHWQDATDWGVAYDYGYFELSPKQVARYEKYNKCRPTTGWVAGVLKEREYNLPERTTVIHTGDWVEIGRQLGGVGTTGKLKLTRGCVAACWAISKFNDKVVLVGFDNPHAGWALTPEEGFPDAYRGLPSTSWKDYKGGGTKYHNHDYIAEDLILKALAKQYGVEVVYAQDVWK